MKQSVWKRINNGLQGSQQHRRWIAALVCFATILSMFSDCALALEGSGSSEAERMVLDCALEIHEHDKDCFDKEHNLICGYADYVVHTHSKDCYDEDGDLVCRIPEKEEHEHTKKCFKEEEVLVCTLAESKGHQHSDACYETVQGKLTCSLEETDGHSHSDACYDEEGNLTCTLREQAAHHHGADCYQQEQKLVCGLEQGEGAHKHDSKCYEKVQNVICGELENHEHTKKCYDKDDNLICGQIELLEHVHDKDCFRKAEQAKEEAPAEEEKTDAAKQEEIAPATETKAVSEMPAVRFDDKCGDVNVTVVAQEGAFPAGTTMELKEVEEDQVMDAVNGAVENQVARVKAIDITFFDADHQEIEPAQAINVTMTAKEVKAEETPVVVHIEDNGDASVMEEAVMNASGEEVSFAADSFSIYVIAYTVDFEHEGYSYSMPGGSGMLLSQLLDILHTDFSISDVAEVSFSDPELLYVTPAEGREDWVLVSLKAFDTTEQLTLTLKDGTQVIIRVTDAARDATYVNLNKYLTKVEIYHHEEDQDPEYIGGSDQTARIRKNRDYQLKLYFAEDPKDPEGQFPDTGVMRYYVPNEVDLGDVEREEVFSISVGTKNTLENNRVHYYPAIKDTQDNVLQQAYIDVEWNSTDPVNYGKLISSALAQFMMEYTARISTDVMEISFSSDVTVGITEDDSFEADLEKNGTYNSASNTIDYTVDVTATGNAKNLTIADHLDGDALSYPDGMEVTVKYYRGDTEITDQETYPDNNAALTLDPNHKDFSLVLAKLEDGDRAVLTYSANVNYGELLNADGSRKSQKNTVTASSSKGQLDREELDMMDGIQYLTVKKDHGAVDNQNGTISVPWTIRYNEERHVDVEGNTLVDIINKGAVDVTTYDKSKPFAVKIYNENNECVKTLDVSWDSINITDFERKIGADGSVNDQYTSWTWVIPYKSVTGLDSDTHYTYEITYYTKIDSKNALQGFVSNEVHDTTGSESFGNLEFGEGIIPHNIEVSKEVIDVSPRYTQWKISFKRPTYAVTRAVLEDYLPAIAEHHVADAFVNEPMNAGGTNHGYTITGLYEGSGNDAGETCAVNATATGKVIFRFQNNGQEGLKGLKEGTADTNGIITVTFFTKNDEKWMKDSTDGTITGDQIIHENKVRLFLNGQFDDASAYAIPRMPSIEKTVDPDFKGTVTTADGKVLPVFKYTLKLTGIDEKAFQNHALVIHDSSNGLVYMSAGQLRNQTINFAPDENADMLIQIVPEKESGSVPAEFENVSDGLWDITIRDDDSNWSAWDVTDENTHETARVYGMKYQLTYYMVVDPGQIDGIINDSDMGKVTFRNVATWSDTSDGAKSDEAEVQYDFKPIHKSLNYDERTRIAQYTIDINPQAQIVHGGTRYKMEDSYRNLSVDFRTVNVQTWPENRQSEVEWAFHGHVGTFWVPDGVHVRITYDGTPMPPEVGDLKPGETLEKFAFTNEASMVDREDAVSHEADLSSHHEGSAVTYGVYLYKYADNNMEKPLAGAVFQLFKEGTDGQPVPMQYKTASNRTPSALWNGISGYATPEQHNVNDNIYFVSGSDGVAEIFLSQARDGVALMKGEQYYLREVRTPDGYQKEDHDWSFVIGDKDYYNHDEGVYVYANESVLQVSNASEHPDLQLRKVFVDNTNSLEYSDQAKATFTITGRNGQGEVVYSKEVTYNDFLGVDVPDPANPGKTIREYQWILPKHTLPAGTYTVTETNAEVTGTELSTDVEAAEGSTAITKSEDGKSFTFTVAPNGDVSVVVTFTNTYEETQGGPGALEITKKAENLTEPNHEFEFTLTKENKYLQADGTLGDQAHVFTFKAGETVRIENIQDLGQYTLTEDLDAAQVEDETLQKVTVTVGTTTTNGESATVKVVSGRTLKATVTNVYKAKNINFTFQKLWVGPDPEDNSTMIWPGTEEIELTLRRHLKDSTTPDDSYVYHYTVNGVGGFASSEEGGPAMAVTADSNGNSHYQFTLENLPKYDANDHEWVYFVTEAPVARTEAQNGSTFATSYGRLSGLNAMTIDGWNAASSDVQKASIINRLKIDKQLTIPVQKLFQGWYDQNNNKVDLTQFEFELAYNNKAVTGNQLVAEKGTVSADKKTVKANANGEVEFNVTELVDLPSTLRWNRSKQTFEGTYEFTVREKVPANKLNGVTYFNVKKNVKIEVVYNWNTGTLTTTMKVNGQKSDQVEITNTYSPETVMLKAIKNWNDNNNQDGRRKNAKFKVTAKVTIPEGKTLTLPKLDAQGKRIVLTGTGSAVDLPVVWFGDGTDSTKVIDLASNYLEVGTDNGASQSRNYPKYVNSYPVVYSIQEDLTDSGLQNDYTVEYENCVTDSANGNVTCTATNKHVPDTMNIIVTKTWDDANAPEQLKKAHQEIVLYLTVNGNKVSGTAEKTLSGTNWTATWENLPVYANGQMIDYQVVEKTVPLGYKFTFTKSNPVLTETVRTDHRDDQLDYNAKWGVANEYAYVNVPVKKIWNDDSNRDGYRPESVVMNLTAQVNGQNIISQISGVFDVSSKTVTGSGNTWQNAGWLKLPKYYHGTEISYNVQENKAEHYNNPSISVDGDTRQVTNTHWIERTTITLTKTWKDNLNQDGKRPGVHDYVKKFVHLYANGQELFIGSDQVPDQPNTYYLYTDSALTKHFVAAWVNQTVKLEGANNSGTYTFTFKDLPKKDQGNVINYTLTETDEDGNVLSTTGTHKNLSGDFSVYEIAEDVKGTNGAFTVKNQYEPETINIKVEKEWDHGSKQLTDEQKQALADLIKVKLIAKVNGEDVDFTKATDYPYTVQLEKSLGADGTITWTGLPKYAPGKVGSPITYSVVETQIPNGYYMTSTGSIDAWNVAKNGTGQITVTNTYQETKVTATKVWNDAHNQDGMRKEVTFQLVESTDPNGTFTPVTGKSTQTIGTLTNLTAVWDELPAWKGNQRVYYKAIEVSAPDGYTSAESFDQRDTGTATAGNFEVKEKITNTYAPKTDKSVTFTKTWNNQGLASNPLTADQFKEKLSLYARAAGTSGAPVSVEAAIAPNWKQNLTVEGTDGSYTVKVTGLPVNLPVSVDQANAQRLEYFLKEDAIANYVAAYSGDQNGFAPDQGTITNTRSTGKLKISKAVVSDRIADKDIEFQFVITAGSNITNGTTYASTGSGAQTVKFENNQAKIKLKKGQEIVIEGLPADVVFTVAENTPNNFTAISNPENGQVKIGNGTTGSVAFTNTRAKGQLTVSKTVNSQVAADHEAVFHFVVTLVDNSITKTYGEMEFVNGVAEFDLKAGESKTAAGLPTDVKYTVTETADDRFTTTKTGDTGTISTTESTAAFTNTRKTNDLHLTKAVNSPFQSERDAYYYFKVTLKHGNAAIANEAFTLEGTDLANAVTFDGNGEAIIPVKGGNTVTIKNLPIGTDYTVAEVAEGTSSLAGAPDNSYDPVLFTKAPANALTGQLPENGSVEAKITNTHNTGKLKISKAVTSDRLADENTEFEFVITAGTDIADGTSYTASGNKTVVFHDNKTTVKLKKGQEIVIEGLPTGVTFTVTETAAANFTGVSNMVDGQVTIGNGTESAVAFTNTRAKGQLTVSKTVNSQVAADHETVFHFVVTLVDNSITKTFGEMEFVNGVAEFDLKAGESKTAAGLPTDVKYTVTETADDRFTTTKTGDTGTISTTASTAAFTNTRKTNDLQLTKAVNSPFQSERDAYYYFKVTLKHGNAAIANEAFTLEGTDLANAVTFDGNGEAIIPVKGGTTVTIKNLPIGTDYTVAEVAEGTSSLAGAPANSFNAVLFSKTAETGLTGQLAETGAFQAAITNTRNTDDLMISKAVVSDRFADKDIAFTFVIAADDPAMNGLTYQTVKGTEEQLNNYLNDKLFSGVTTGSVTFEDGKVTVTLKKDERILIEGLPVGIKFTVTENDTANFTSASAPADGQVIISNTADNAVAFTNTRALGNLTVSKTVESQVAADSSIDFHFTVTLDDNTIHGTYGDMDFTNGVAEFDLKAGESKTAADLPTDVNYTVAETENDRFTTKVNDADSLTVDGTISTTESTAAFTNTRKTNDLKLTKAVNSPFQSEHDAYYYFKVTLKHGEAAIANETFVLEGTKVDSVTFDQGGVAIIPVKGDTTVTIKNLPIDTVYTVEEVADEAGTVAGAPELFNGSEPEYLVNDVADTAEAHQIDVEKQYQVSITNSRKFVPVTVVKVDGTDLDKKLKDAVFTLFWKEGTEDKRIVLKSNDNGVLVKSGDDETVLSSELVQIDENGVIQLADGNYSLRENLPPDGYRTLNGYVTIKVENSDISYVVKEFTQISGSADGRIVTDATETSTDMLVTLKVPNVEGVDLPKVGGPGTTAFTVSGTALMTMGAALLLCKRRKREED